MHTTSSEPNSILGSAANPTLSDREYDAPTLALLARGARTRCRAGRTEMRGYRRSSTVTSFRL